MGLVAIATSNGVTIDGRLDVVGTFYVFHSDGSRIMTLSEKRSVPGHQGCPEFPLLPQSAALLLADMDFVLATFVPRETGILLLTRGVMAIAVRGEVAWALEAYRRRGWVLEEQLAELRRCLHLNRNFAGQGPSDRAETR